jgi:hypothetical protein
VFECAGNESGKLPRPTGPTFWYEDQRLGGLLGGPKLFPLVYRANAVADLGPLIASGSARGGRADLSDATLDAG